MEPSRQNAKSRPEQAIVEQSIQDGIRHVLGKSGLEMVLSLHPLNELSADPAGFHEFLKGIFKEDGAAIIEIEIASRLLEKVGHGRAVEGRSFLSRLGTAFSRAKSSGGVAAREKDALRQFMAFQSVRKGRSGGEVLGFHRRTNNSGSFQLKGSLFAFANKK